MENKTLKIVLIAAISISLIGNIALFWQLKEEQEINTYKIEEVAKNASEKLKKNSSEAQVKIDKLNQTINEKKPRNRSAEATRWHKSKRGSH
ncbi:Uncharacterised protein [Enterococcus hirae]|nr:Uncharacterised protein [Enterococcus hirae]